MTTELNKIITGEHYKSFVCKDGFKVSLFKINNDPDNYFLNTKMEDKDEETQIIPIKSIEAMMEGIEMREVPMSPTKPKTFLAVLSVKK